jgi:uncharacterized protein
VPVTAAGEPRLTRVFRRAGSVACVGAADEDRADGSADPHGGFVEAAEPAPSPSAATIPDLQLPPPNAACPPAAYPVAAHNGFQPVPGGPSPPPTGWSPAPQPEIEPARTHRWGLGAYLLVELVFLVTSALVGLFVIGDGDPTAGELAVALGVPTLIAAGLAMIITKVRGNGPFTDLRLRWSWHDVRLGLAFGFGGLFVTLPASMLYVMIVGKDATSAVGEVFGQLRAPLPLALVIFVTVVFIAPLCEEIVYRGLLWGAVERLGAGRWMAMIVTTLLFALAHFEFTRTPLLLVVAIPIALARFYTRGLLASIVAHQVNNLLPGVALLLGLLGTIPMV